MRLVSKQEADNIGRVLSMTNVDPSSIGFLKEMVTKYIGAAQTAVTCWTCPNSIQLVYRRLVDEIKDYKTIEDDQTGDGTTGFAIADTDKQQNQKRSKPGRKPKDL